MSCDDAFVNLYLCYIIITNNKQSYKQLQNSALLQGIPRHIYDIYMYNVYAFIMLKLLKGLFNGRQNVPTTYLERC